MNPLDELTVCITNFGRAKFLDRAILSCKAAGIRRLTISSVCPDIEVYKVIDKHQHGWLSYDITRVAKDIGCNDSWMLAAMLSRTDRIIILHDDDTLRPEFGKAYVEDIAPRLNPNTFASWRASLLFNDGTTRFTEYFHGPTRLLRSRELMDVFGKYGRLSLSPVVSVLDRDMVIAGCKAADYNLSPIPECILRPGMLLGTEIVVYSCHVSKFLEWLYVDKILSHYGSHAGSGTVDAENSGKIPLLAKGYDHARKLCGIPQK